MELTLERFRSAHRDSYGDALAEIRAGKKQSHWMWHIFPQIEGLSTSAVGQYYAIRGREEAIRYWGDAMLRQQLVEITEAVLELEGDMEEVFGFPDNVKLRSCMTLFYLVTGEELFRQVLEKHFGAELCRFTKQSLGL